MTENDGYETISLVHCFLLLTKNVFCLNGAQMTSKDYSCLLQDVP